MPTYEYECEACFHRFELFQLMTAAPIRTCPVCQGPVRRLIGRGAGIIFKGSGFYQTDHRSPSYQKKAEADKKPSSAPSSKASASSSEKKSEASSCVAPAKEK